MSKAEQKTKMISNITKILDGCNDVELMVIANMIIAYLKK